MFIFKFESYEYIWEKGSLIKVKQGRCMHHNEFPRETNSQRKVENQNEPAAQHNKKLPEFWWSKVSLFTSPWGHIPWEHGHQESSDPLAIKCLFHAGA